MPRPDDASFVACGTAALKASVSSRSVVLLGSIALTAVLAVLAPAPERRVRLRGRAAVFVLRRFAVVAVVVFRFAVVFTFRFAICLLPWFVIPFLHQSELTI
jgi:hypothetical protein